jgi:hypothetical protein
MAFVQVHACMWPQRKRCKTGTDAHVFAWCLQRKHVAHWLQLSMHDMQTVLMQPLTQNQTYSDMIGHCFRDWQAPHFRFARFNVADEEITVG